MAALARNAVVSGSCDAEPVGAEEFSRLMARLGPWPQRPAVAVGLSGGRDSLALTHLLKDWVVERQGRLLALTVDHRLRPGSEAESQGVADRCRSLSIEQRTLRWHRAEALSGTAPIQAAAREARYELLLGACREAGIVTLCLAHQADDQSETFLLRLAAGSAPPGLGAMSARRAMDEVVVLRPLLAVPRERLTATLRRSGQGWLDDPSNVDERHRRVAIRQARPALAAAGLDGAAMEEAAALFGRLRACLEHLAAPLLARALSWHPAGFARLDAGLLAAAPRPLGRLALAEVLRALGGGAHAPGEAALNRALERFGDERGRGFTLGHVRLLRRKDGWLVLPEAAALKPLALEPGSAQRWGCWRVAVAHGAPPGLRLEPLGQAGWQALAPHLGRQELPGPVLWGLPALSDAAGLAAVPPLAWRRQGQRRGAGKAKTALAVEACNLHFIAEPPVGLFGFTVAWRERHII